ncbi:lateral signaling target protein 2 homolog [Pelodytes ibericus]
MANLGTAYPHNILSLMRPVVLKPLQCQECYSLNNLHVELTLRWYFTGRMKTDPRLLAKFFYVDQEVNAIVHELQCLDLQKDVQNYLLLLSQLHNTQDRMLVLLEQMLEQVVSAKRRPRDYHMKFPDDTFADNMNTQLLFAAELMVGGTYVEVEERDGVLLRPLAQDLLRSLIALRNVLRAQSLDDPGVYPEQAQRALLQYDTLCAEFEWRYMSLVSSVKTPEEIYEQQDVAVLFCETVSRALRREYLTQEMIDDCEPELMISIPRLAIISGLLIYPDGPLNINKCPEEMCDLFSPFHGLLRKIKELLHTLTEDEVSSLERALCSASSKNLSKRLSCLSDSSDSWALASENVEQPDAKLDTVELLLNPESNVETPQECSAAVSSGCSGTSSVEVDLSQPCANTEPTSAARSTTGDLVEDSKIPDKIPMSDSEATAAQCIKRTTTEQIHKPRLRKSRVQDIRSRYQNDRDMLHRLFVCISGVADQLQTNFASDLRVILKTVFEATSSKQENERTTENASRLQDCVHCQNQERLYIGANPVTPEWVPDNACAQCTSCFAPFTLLRRRHHCRCCGKIFCSRCSSYTTSAIPSLPMTVRVCSHCYHVHCKPLEQHEEGAQGQD